jgi:hypothetical protein
MDEALRQRAADALIQVTTDNRGTHLLILYLNRIKVEGMAVKMK